MKKHYQIQVSGSSILLGLSVGVAVLDVLTNDLLLERCQEMIASHRGDLSHTQMGSFGVYDVTLNLHADGQMSLFIDGPDFSPGLSQSAAIWPERDTLLKAIAEARDLVKTSKQSRAQ